jgi:hypothetical protein
MLLKTQLPGSHEGKHIVFSRDGPRRLKRVETLMSFPRKRESRVAAGLVAESGTPLARE